MESDSKKKKVFIKLVVIGDSGVGKTSLIHRYITTKFLQEFKPTIGAEFSNKELIIDGKTVVAQIWDTAGQERYQALGASFYRGADCCAIVFDRSDRETYEHLAMWKKQFLSHCGCSEGEKFPFLIIGNKSDLIDEVLIKDKEVLDWCKENGSVDYIEVSAKDNVSVEEAFRILIEKGAKRDNKNDTLPRKIMTKGRVVNLNSDSKSKTQDGKKKKCC